MAAQSGTRTLTRTATERLALELTARWADTAEQLTDRLRYALLPAGKLLRPLLFLESARAVGYRGEDLVSAAVSVEYLHAATLVHDDIIDGDPVRRGRPSLHLRNGVPDAIVTGDALLFAAFQTLTGQLNNGAPAAMVVPAIAALADAGMDVCRGQQEEAELIGHSACGLDRYLRVAALKTGALFRGACAAGAALAGGDPAAVALLGGFGERLGVAFQMHDDLLPYNDDPAAAGKSATSDAANRRPTYPVLIAYQLGDTADRVRIDRALSGELPPEVAYELMAEVLSRLGATKLAREHIDAEIVRARRMLDSFSDPDRIGLDDLLDLVAESMCAAG